MNIHNNYPIRSSWNIVKIILTTLLTFSYLVSNIYASSSGYVTAEDQLVITGSEFHQRSQFDTGEFRLFLKNINDEPMSISQLKLYRLILDVKDEISYKEDGAEVNYLCSKLSPPVLMPGQNGELLVKLLKTPPNNSKYKCIIYGKTGRISETLLSIKHAPVWISYVGFSEDLGKVYVYGQNNTRTPLSIRLLEVAGVNVGDNFQSINNNLPPGDKGCLVFKMLRRPVLGEYVHIAISTESNEQEFRTHRIVKASNKFTLLSEGGFPNPKLGLDSKSFFVQIMSCPAHEYDTHEEAARKFVNDYYSKFSQNSHLLLQMWICRSGKPQAWYKFGALPDVAVMNPVLLASQVYESDTKASERFCPFFWLAANAKKAVAPNRYLACIPINSKETSFFLRSNRTPEEIKSLVYCAIAAGAKGILYRGTPSSDRLSQDAFVRLNRELQQLKPMLIIAEPVNWASTTDNNYVATSLLCGDEAILVIVFDRRYFSEQQKNKLYTPAFGKVLRPVKIQVKVPEGFSISELKSMYAPLSRKLWSGEEGQLDFTANMVNSVQVYRAILIRTSSVSSLEE
jgi:hypothetical protein